jgi:3-phosphoshikimate 1-carboxyvinyltransferase
LAALADGESTLEAPLVSADALSAAQAVQALGAEVVQGTEQWRVKGVGGTPRPQTDTIDVGNSGTTLLILLGIAALLPPECELILTGDEQICRRPAAPLIDSLKDLGADIVSIHDNGCPPLRVRGGLSGGQTTLHATTSQYLSSLLMACPLAPQASTVTLTLLNERPYVQMTLDWLASQGIELSHENMDRFQIPGGQHYQAFKRRIPADFSSATFFLAAGALSKSGVSCLGLDMSDSQGDKAVVTYLERMGAQVEICGDRIDIRADQLQGVEIDMNETPDALPVMAVVGCFAHGETRLVNVAHARIKETDRIAVMCRELRKMGADIEERPDGLVIRHSQLHGTEVDGHHDHRVVMALALAGLNCPGTTTVATAEAAGITFPNYAELMQSVGADLAVQE